MELSDLTIFKTVAEQGGVTHAAKKLHRVPSNITARLRKLETELGKPLFLREKNRMIITPEGTQFLRYAHEILALAQTAVNDLQTTEPCGQLRIGTMEAAAASRLPEPLLRFHQQYAQVDIQISTQPSARSIEWILEGKLDVALVSDPPSDGRLCMRKLCKETLVLVTDIKHPKIKSGNDLASNPTLLTFSNGCAYRTRLLNWIASADRCAKVMEIQSYHTLLSCVAAGMGIGIAPKSILSMYPFVHAIKTHRLPPSWSNSDTYAVWRSDQNKPSIDAFCDCF